MQTSATNLPTDLSTDLPTDLPTHLATNGAETAQKLQRMLGYLAQDPENTPLLLDVIDLCQSLGQWEQAQTHLDLARRLEPDNLVFQQRQANLWMAQNNWAAANALLASLYRTLPDLTLAHDLAYTQFRLGDYRAAQTTLQPCLAHTPPQIARTDSITLMLRCWHHLGELEPALALAQQYAAQAGPEMLSVMSLLYLDADDVQNAQAVSARALALATGPSVLEAQIVQATLALGQGEVALAAQQFDQVLQQKPDDGRSWAGIGLVYLVQRDWPGAARALEQAVLFMPQHIGTRHILAWCKILAGDLLAARAVLNAALAMDRNFSESHGGLAVVEALAGNRDLAQGLVRRALGLNPHSLTARFAQTLLARQGNGADDTARFQQEVEAILAGEQGVFGENLAAMLQKMMRA